MLALAGTVTSHDNINWSCNGLIWYYNSCSPYLYTLITDTSISGGNEYLYLGVWIEYFEGLREGLCCHGDAGTLGVEIARRSKVVCPVLSLGVPLLHCLVASAVSHILDPPVPELLRMGELILFGV